jgi:hypothetical protein
MRWAASESTLTTRHFFSYAQSGDLVWNHAGEDVSVSVTCGRWLPLRQWYLLVDRAPPRSLRRLGRPKCRIRWCAFRCGRLGATQASRGCLGRDAEHSRPAAYGHRRCPSNVASERPAQPVRSSGLFCSRQHSQIAGPEASTLRDPGEHPGSDLFVVVEGEREVCPASPR